jgi:hypothetical protein
MRAAAAMVGFLSMIALGSCLCPPQSFARAPTATVSVNPLRNAYYGDLHLHTSYSLDAYVWSGTKVDPDEAYRFAKGETVQYLGESVQRREPLDFMAVTDHSENLGVLDDLEDPSSLVSRSSIGQAIKAAIKLATLPDGKRVLEQLAPIVFSDQVGEANPLPLPLRAESVSAWQREVEFANRNYQPGKFTTFIAYEWTSMGQGVTMANLHRNVIFKGNSAPYPFTSFDSKKPEDLWNWLEAIRKQGFEALAIPHSANFSNGLMYDWVDSAGKPIDEAYAEERQLNEPVAQMSSISGSDEVHPLLAPSDEFADFEIYDRVSTTAPGSFLRDALGRGVVLERRLGVNPYKYGFVGGSDLHGGLSVSAQTDFAGGDRPNIGAAKRNKAQASAILSGDSAQDRFDRWLSSGSLTCVWAESNTRESIYAALRRRETFATSGTRLKFRFFGGWNLGGALLRRRDWVAAAYAKGVAMGGDLPARPHSAVPSFAIWALKDPNGANLDRAQVIKVWEEDGQQREKIFDVVWAGHRKPDRDTGRISPVGNTVDLKTGLYRNDIGATELKIIWKDPDFKPNRFAAYYLRVLEIPTPRWSTILAAENGLSIPRDVPATQQQRGWSSPIWYAPKAEGGRTH